MNCERWTLIHTVCGWILAVGRITYYSLKLRRSQKWCTQADRVNHCLFVFFVLFSTFLVAAVYRTRSRQALIKFHDFLLFRVRFQYRFFVGVSVLVLLLLRSIASKYNKFNPIQSNKCLLVRADTFTNRPKKHFYFTLRLFWVIFLLRAFFRFSLEHTLCFSWTGRCSFSMFTSWSVIESRFVDAQLQYDCCIGY